MFYDLSNTSRVHLWQKYEMCFASRIMLIVEEVSSIYLSFIYIYSSVETRKEFTKCRLSKGTHSLNIHIYVAIAELLQDVNGVNTACFSERHVGSLWFGPLYDSP